MSEETYEHTKNVAIQQMSLARRTPSNLFYSQKYNQAVAFRRDVDIFIDSTLVGNKHRRNLNSVFNLLLAC